MPNLDLDRLESLAKVEYNTSCFTGRSVLDLIAEVRRMREECADLKAQNQRYASRLGGYARTMQDQLDPFVARLTAAESSLAAIHGWATEVAEQFGDGWPHHGGCQGDAADSGCPLCRILAATRAES